MLDVPVPHDKWGISDGEMIVCEYNNALLPIGLSAVKFIRMVGKLIKGGH